MQIKRLQIDDYLCLVDFDIAFDTVSGGSSTILIGENGAGKSTMIECILNILMSFDSPAIEKQIDYSYSMEYNYAQKAVCIVQSNHNYRITVDDVFCEGSYKGCALLSNLILCSLNASLRFILGPTISSCLK